MNDRHAIERSELDLSATDSLLRLWPPSIVRDQADSTDRALAALRTGLASDQIVQAFGGGAAERARLAAAMRSRKFSERSALRSSARPSAQFLAGLESELLVCFDATHSVVGVPIPALMAETIEFSPSVRPERARAAGGMFGVGRRYAASLAIAATVIVALFARIGSDSIRGIDSSATAVAATGTITIGTPVALGTEVPAVAHRGVDG